MKDILIRSQIERLLKGETHMSLAEAVAEYPEDKINMKPPNVPYKFSQIELIDSSIVSDAANQAALEAVKPLVFPTATTGSTTVMFTIDLQVRTINK
jgi:hypothetical protein